LVSALTVAIILGRYELGRLFFGSSEASAATVELTATLLLVGATFFIADGLQTIMAGALRGINDTRMTLLFAAIGYWCVAFPIAWVLAFNAGLGAVGVWIGFSTGTFVYAGLLILRFRMLTRRLAG
jgi:MATE family multidrug resistance protein